MTDRSHVDAYIDLLEGLTASNVDTLRGRCRADVHFRDPFNDICGVDVFVEILIKMFADLREIEFSVTDRAYSSDGVFLRWDLAFRSGAGSTRRRIEGMSVITFDDQGLVTEHVDYWDAASQVYEALPVIGVVLRAIRRRLGRNAS
jgi:steroid delta-isomerase